MRVLSTGLVFSAVLFALARCSHSLGKAFDLEEVTALPHIDRTLIRLE
jgi:hypothetical protein